MIDFPASPTVGQIFISGAQSWTWDGTKWVASGVYVGPPQFSNANRIINGDMRIDQRGVASGAGGTAQNVYTVDRWQYLATQASKGTWQRGASGPLLLAQGFGNYLVFTSSSAYAVLVGDAFAFNQVIEADMVSDFAWGTPNAQPVTLSFWMQSSLTGQFGGSIANLPAPPTRSYPFTFNIPVANTWTKVVITIPGDAAGTWVMSGNLGGLVLYFDLGSGATFRGPAGAWANGNFRGANGAVSVVGTNGAQFYLTGVKLELGSVATPFNRKSPQESLADCQRYYQTGQLIYGGQAGAATQTLYNSSLLPVLMRTTPTVTAAVVNYVNCTLGTGGAYGAYTIWIQATATAVGTFLATTSFTASAEL